MKLHSIYKGYKEEILIKCSMIQREILLPVHGMEKCFKGLIGAQLL